LNASKMLVYDPRRRNRLQTTLGRPLPSVAKPRARGS